MNFTSTPPSLVSLPTTEKVYSQEDVAQVVKAATLYRSMYEETKLQVQLLQNQLHTFTDTQLWGVDWSSPVHQFPWPAHEGGQSLPTQLLELVCP